MSSETQKSAFISSFIENNNVDDNVMKFVDGLNERYKDAFNIYNDNWIVPATQTTLIGEDFTSLYDGNCSTRKRTSKDGTAFDELIPNVDYKSEMLHPALQANDASSIVKMKPENRAAYEIVLLSKKYASLSENATDKTAIQNEYQSKMNAYKTYCESNNIVWNSVMGTVSSELQYETAIYSKDATSLFGAKTASDNARNANIAHNLQLEAAGPEYVDQAIPQLSTYNISYDDTLDESISVIGAQNAFNGVKGSITGVFASVSSCLTKFKDTVKNYFEGIKLSNEKSIEYFNEKYDMNTKDAVRNYELAKEAFGDIIAGEDISENDYSYPDY